MVITFLSIKGNFKDQFQPPIEHKMFVQDRKEKWKMHQKHFPFNKDSNMKNVLIHKSTEKPLLKVGLILYLIDLVNFDFFYIQDIFNNHKKSLV